MNRATGARTAYPDRPGATAVELASGLERRWSPVRFDSAREVDPEDLTAALEAARWAASCFGEEPWRFLVARRSDPWRAAVEESLAEGNAWARRASVLLVGLTGRTFNRNGRENRHAAHDLGLALGGLMVEAMARGLATHAMAGFDPEAVVRAFEVPDGYDALWVTALGHHDPELRDAGLVERERQPRGRRPLAASAFGRTFGEAHPGLRAKRPEPKESRFDASERPRANSVSAD